MSKIIKTAFPAICVFGNLKNRVPLTTTFSATEMIFTFSQSVTPKVKRLIAIIASCEYMLFSFIYSARVGIPSFLKLRKAISATKNFTSFRRFIIASMSQKRFFASIAM